MIEKVIAIFSILITAGGLFLYAMIGGFAVDTAMTQLDKTLPNTGTTIQQADELNGITEDAQTIQKVSKTGSLKGASFALPMMVVIGAGAAIWKIVS